MRGRCAAVLALPLFLLSTGASPQDGAPVVIVTADYDTLAAQLDGRMDFEDLPATAEPGVILDKVYRVPGAALAEHFAGQSVSIRHLPEAWGGGRHDELSHADLRAPLALRSGTAGQSLTVAQHRGFGSGAVFPVGPNGAQARSGRGEGALALLFDSDQQAVGLRIHADYADPLGGRPPPGVATVQFHARDGTRLGIEALTLGHGVASFGFVVQGAGAGIAAITIHNTDPGGIAIDDIVFALAPLTG